MSWKVILNHLIKAFCDKGGNVSMIAALAAIPVILGVTGAIEMNDIARRHTQLQNAADAGALSGAGQLAIAAVTKTQISQTAIAVATQSLKNQGLDETATFVATVDMKAGSVTLKGDMAHKPLIGFMGLGKNTLSATATAENVQRIPLCILQTDSGSGISVSDTARIRATGCAIHANADINVDSGAQIQAEATQAVGTVSGPIEPVGRSGALPIDDPFANLDLNPKKLCNSILTPGEPVVPIQLGSGVMYLPPGVHCTPILVLGKGTLMLQPGDHYFLAPLVMNQDSTLRGDDVALIFGAGNAFNFSQNASVRLSARKTGPYAGFLIATSRDNVGVFTIASGKVSQLLGTIYTPNAKLVIDTGGNVAQDSAWSVIVAKSLTLRQSPILVINNNYASGGVPVPEGVGPMKSAPKLTH
ncbi:Tad domain-containing protein [Asticcacaulis sp. 201]|uniref:TadE/TadG family type IV pilus assembly protein n=1 Tax=Asticcacaulis sp. 201 TaxID=3028787 RepID=UPI002915DE4D|nr:Tad domain-containing protein [Asticcacaulis sp. 201]MDV6332276.1 Tad domain-containing protein [Asticcacaulis sp. 201]